MVIFDHAHPKIIESSLGFAEFLLASKNQFIQTVAFWDAINFGVLWPYCPDPFLTMPLPKKFFVNF